MAHAIIAILYLNRVENYKLFPPSYQQNVNDSDTKIDGNADKS